MNYLQQDRYGMYRDLNQQGGPGPALMGLGDKLFAVPWNALRLDTVNKRFVLDADKEQLKNAPGFDKDAWPSMADRQWGSAVHDYYGTRPYWDH